jgi:hypothetical protein
MARLEQRVDKLAAQVADLVASAASAAASATTSFVAPVASTAPVPTGQALGFPGAPAPVIAIPGDMVLQQQQMVATLDRILRAIENLTPAPAAVAPADPTPTL